ncbi:MAG TPA: YdeI/OmpD-associated family protein [Blastocatellia bacterium]|nr:YdeI/OmpD-associated family protein [Blastocatellia bacterium]
MSIEDSQPVKVTGIIERKQENLPRYLVIPSSAIEHWALKETTVVEVELNGRRVERRTIKNWDSERWFISITEKDCRLLGLETGDSADVTLKAASAELPEELISLLLTDSRASAAWNRMTPGQQRMLKEEIAAGKQSATRARRARKSLLNE